MRTYGRLTLAVLLGAAWTAASAHTGHGTQGLWAGMAHPFGIDHWLAMVAVGVWSAGALPRHWRALGPVVFMLGLLAGAALGLALPSAPMVEVGIAASLVLFGAMLFAPRAWPLSAGLALVGAAALLHGLAHGAELPATAGFAGYAAGFLISTASLHALGLGAGQAMARAQAWLWRAAGVALGSAGLWLVWA